MSGNIKWPVTTRGLHNHHSDSSIWNDLIFRECGIVISTYVKAGTTWMQQIISQLLFEAGPDLAVAEMMLWMDLRVLPKEVKFPIIETPNHQRFITTHVPVNALEVVPKAECICSGLDGREAVWVL